MSTGRQTVTARDLVDEAKKRIIVLSTCVVGLSYLMSLTSSSVLVNLPAAALLIVIIRYLSLDYDMRRKAAIYKSKPSLPNGLPQRKPALAPKSQSDKSEWKRKVNSPVVEDAIDQFTRHIVSEWVTDLWYSRITPDTQGPEELVLILNGVMGEFSSRMRNVNLIDLFTRDIIKLVCTHLELFRACQRKIEKQRPLTIEQRDLELKAVLYSENKLHPALFSAEAEYKVLQHLTDGLISLTFKPENLQCSFFHYVVREILSCAVIRPTMNLINPRFINERIESVVISASKADNGACTEPVISISSQSSRLPDPSVKGVELTHVKRDQSVSAIYDADGILHSKDTFLSVDTRSTRSYSSLPSDTKSGDRGDIQQHHSGGEWGNMLDDFSRRKTEALAPANFENMWAKGRNYKMTETNEFTKPVLPSSSAITSNSVDKSKALGNRLIPHNDPDRGGPLLSTYEEDKDDLTSSSSSSYSSEDERSSNITGLDSPGIKVWDGKSNSKLSVTHIHHPLESSEGQKLRKKLLPKRPPVRKRSRVSRHTEQVWQEVERTSFTLGDRRDVVSSTKENVKSEDSDDSGAEPLGSIYSGTSASSSISSISMPESNNVITNAQKSPLLDDSFFRLRCEVLCANIVKSGSTTFAVYSISVTDVNNVSWSIKRRFRHFEELHWRLKEFVGYNLHLPPKHFLSTGLDVPVIQERCNLLDIYLKRLVQLPTISESIEVWDFLSVDSQTYSFSNSISILETFSVRGNSANVGANVRVVGDPLTTRRELSNAAMKDSSSQMKHNHMANEPRISTKNVALSPGKPIKELRKPLELLMDDGDPTLPSEWVPPNLSVPIFDLVDVIFQLQDGGWIRRQAFWVAKQVLQLGMSDAFDDWVIEKIQLLRRGSVVASGIKRLEQILWPDGIFITKQPNRHQPTPAPRASQVSSHGRPPYPPTNEETMNPEELQEQEAQRRRKLVYELMIDKAPATIVGLVGRKEYEQCAKDLFYFIQSSVCLKQLVFDLLELLLMSAFPELDHVFLHLHAEKHKFGVLEHG